MIDNTLTWNNHIEMIIPKLGVTCFVVTAIEPFVTMVYHSSSHSFINYGIIFQ